MTWALVTGSSKGIGAAVAVGLAADGHDVIVHYGGDEDGARAVASRCGEHGVRTAVVGADLRTDAGPLLDAAADAGGVGILVNNAGVTADGLAMTMSDDDFALTWQVNVAAAFTLTRGVLRGMLRARAGRVVNLSSVVGLHGNAGQVNYAASKAALVGMTKTLAREVGRRGITVNAVAPGFIETAMTEASDTAAIVARIPAARLGTVDDVAAVVRFLCSPQAAYVNGAVVQVDGGLFA
ncbi:MAG TPA: SDR family NAD(P)-dependent oxidoreductase [Euzebyales bacterium]|nr:SDR family NAD(P)-dependent oxidoreductase [Euzebyales bacterium]